MFGSQPTIHPFRTEWSYNNLVYAIVGLAMGALTGKSYSSLLESRIARPFGLSRTGLSFNDSQSRDVAKTYLVIEDGTAVTNNASFFVPGTAMVAAGGISSSVNDLLVFYAAMLQQLSRTADARPSQHLLKGPSVIISGKSFMKDSAMSTLERSSGLGWIRTQLPGTLGAMGLNPWLSQMPLINTQRLALYHQ